MRRGCNSLTFETERGDFDGLTFSHRMCFEMNCLSADSTTMSFVIPSGFPVRGSFIHHSESSFTLMCQARM